MGWQGVEDGGLLGSFTMTQLVLGVPQHDRPAATVGYRIDFACRQFMQAFLGLMQGLDQGGNLLDRFLRRGGLARFHAAMSVANPRASNTVCVWLSVPTMI